MKYLNHDITRHNITRVLKTKNEILLCEVDTVLFYSDAITYIITVPLYYNGMTVFQAILKHEIDILRF